MLKSSFLLENIHKYRVYILAGLFILTILLFWPGIAMHDSSVQYQQAIQGQYSDHHPPLMSFVWRHLDMLHAGSGLMFLLQISLIYIAVYLLLKAANHLQMANKHIGTLLLLILPIYPQILIYEVVVMKDVQMAAAFLCSAAILAYHSVTQRYVSLPTIMLTLVLMLYGAAVKFQGQFIVIVLAVWLGSLSIKSKSLARKVIMGLLFYALLISTIYLINGTLVNNKNKTYSWQYVKLYDLAAMSVQLNEDLIPHANKTTTYTFAELKNRFRYPAIDSVAFMQDPLLETTSNPYAMEELELDWQRAVGDHPRIYLQHRLKNMYYILVARPGFAAETQDVPLQIHNEFAPGTILHTWSNFFIGAIFFIFMAHLPVVILGLAYIYLAIKSWGQSIAAIPLLAFNLLALAMVGLVFFMSMAGTPRYTYVAILMIHASHVFAYKCLKLKRKL